MALSTYMFDNTMQGYHHRGLIQNHGLLGQQGSPTAPTDMQWVGTFQESHTQRIYDGNDPNPPVSLPFYRQNVAVGSPFNPTGFTAVASPNYDPQLVIDLSAANTGATSPYGCPVDWRNADALVDITNDSIVWHGPDSVAQRDLARLEVYNAVTSDSLLQLNSALSNFKHAFDTTDLGALQHLADVLAPSLSDTARNQYGLKAHNTATTGKVATLWKEMLILGFKKWQHPDSTIVLSGADSTRLIEVAQLCPYTVGPAVGLARMMLFAPTKEYFSLMHQCELPEFTPPAERHGQEPQVEAAVKVSLFPNPTSGKVTVQFKNCSPDANCQLRLFGADGKPVYSTRIQRPNQELDLRLTPGLYLFEIRCDDGLFDKGKLVITAR